MSPPGPPPLEPPPLPCFAPFFDSDRVVNHGPTSGERYLEYEKNDERHAFNIGFSLQCPQADLFHPLTSLEWQRELYSVLSFNMLPVQAAVLDGELYVLGKKSAQSRHIEPRSYVYALARHGQGGSEIRSPLPTRRSAFTAYQDKLVLVGGIDATGLTGKIHCLQKPLEYNSQWINDDVKLPPMRTPRCGAAVLSIGQHLLVAGGEGFDGAMTAVEVFNGKEWRPTLSLPKEGKDMTSTVLNGKWILMGGTLGRSVFCANIDGLIQCGGWWKELPEAPLEKSCATVFGNHLLAIGGKQPSLSPSDVEGEEGTYQFKCVYINPSCDGVCTYAVVSRISAHGY